MNWIGVDNTYQKKNKRENKPTAWRISTLTICIGATNKMNRTHTEKIINNDIRKSLQETNEQEFPNMVNALIVIIMDW